MAFTSGQLRQLLRLGNPDSSFDKADRFATLGLVQQFSTNLTEAQRRQLHRLGIGDSSVTTGDRYAINGNIQSLGASTTIIDLFDVEWQIEPTWERLLPDHDGAIDAEMGQYVVSFIGGTLTVFVPFPMRVTMQPTEMFFTTKVVDQLSGVTQFITFKAAKTWVTDQLGFRTKITDHLSFCTTSKLFAGGITRTADSLLMESGDFLLQESGGKIDLDHSVTLQGKVVTGSVTVTDYVAAQVRIPGT